MALLARVACLAPGEPIPYHLLVLTAHRTDDDMDVRLRIADAVNRLIELGLIREEENATFRMHRLIVAYLQDIADIDLAIAQAAVENVLFTEAKRINESRNPGPLQAWQVHLRIVVDRAQGRVDTHVANLCHVLGNHLLQVGDYDQAKVYIDKVVAIRQKILGQEHPDTASSLTDLGIVATGQGEYDAAQMYYEQALTIQKKILGFNHLDIAATINNLGYILQLLGNLTDSLRCHEQALGIRQVLSGPDTTLTAESLGNLA